jgi:hypothetical protein
MKAEGARMSRTALIVAVAALTLLVMAERAKAQSVVVMPRSGSQFQSFTFIGSGFMPEAELEAVFTSPDGEDFPYYVDGDRSVITASSRGSFRVTVVPAVDFAGARPGRWTATFCLTDSSSCWKVSFTVSRRG